jgi:hypothetical protein
MSLHVLDLARGFVRGAGLLGSVALDGTAGNGHDTLFLARLVGSGGHVYGFDIQGQAIGATSGRLEEAGVSERVTLFQEDHARLRELLPLGTTLRAAMFNLGYLPHGDKGIITSTTSTVAALEGALERLESSGVVTVVLYSGHPGGQEESNAVLEWARALAREVAEVGWYQRWNARTPAPSLIVISKR